MKKINLQQYAKQAQETVGNKGNKKECAFALYAVGIAKRGDNIPAEVKADVLDVQVKSSKSSLGKGDNMDAIIARDAAKRYAYVSEDYQAYLMSIEEYRAFTAKFAFVNYESKKNGGATKMRLLPESGKMLRWLEERVA